jgi:ubiquinone/menaquinone biosynthesis C-methylase UbiE
MEWRCMGGNAMSDAGEMFSDGRAYERMMGRWSRLAGATFIDWLAPEKGLSWIDVGCGNGAFTEVLIARAAPQAVTGIDPSEAQIAYARERPGARLATFQVGDAQALPFADARFDAASMALAITFIPDPPKAVAEMARVVRKGGIVATYMWDLAAGGVPLQPLFTALEAIGFERLLPPSAPFSQAEMMRDTWEEAGLVAVGTRQITVEIAFADFDDFWDSLAVPIGPHGKFIAALSTSQREAVRESLAEIVPVDAEGRIAYMATANAVKGRVA